VRRFGTQGQAQSGIDIYARKEKQASYVVYQCRRVATLADADVRKAVDDFLDREWACKSSVFFCLTLAASDLQDRVRAVVDPHRPELEQLVDAEVRDRGRRFETGRLHSSGLPLPTQSLR
jgi:hypothetical protein